MRLNGEDWRTLRDRWRLTAAAVLATHPRATTENVAAAVGYGSARAVCTALSRARLPSPGKMRQAVDALRS
jgi:transcriptional regulator GlxA family with amidase domain